VAELLQGVSLLEAIAVVLALIYLVLAIRENSLCWIAAFVSSVLSIFVFAAAQLYMQSALQIFYAAMAVYGWLQWTRGVGTHAGSPVHIHTWPVRAHVLAFCCVGAASAGFAWALSHTSQAMPLLDSFATVASILTTWMVANKLLENWVYWFVIDSISIYLYVSQGLLLYAGLFVVYLVLVVIGFRQWRAELLRAQAESPAPRLG
jgi:nicotinamide mononucleotide transporter